MTVPGLPAGYTGRRPDPAHPERLRQALLDVLIERVAEHASRKLACSHGRRSTPFAGGSTVMSEPMRGRLVAAVVVAAISLVGCGDQPDDDIAGPATEPPATDPTVVGFVTDVVPFEPITDGCVEPDPDADPDAPVSSDDEPVCSDPATAPLGTVLVEEDPAAVSGSNKISFTVDSATTLLIESSGAHDPLSFADLADGMAATGWADGPITESYPAQARAAAIVVRPN